MIGLFHKLSPVIKISARILVVDRDTILENAVIIVHEGRVREIMPAESATKVRADKKINLTEDILHPGFINAHSHLELSFLKDRLTPGMRFTDWIAAVVKKKAKVSPARSDSAIRNAITSMIRSGTTCVGDIASSGKVTPRIISSGLRAVIFHEAIGFDPKKAGLQLKKMVDGVERAQGSEIVTHGVSPHAVYSVSGALMRGVADYAAIRGRPLAIHLAETPEEALFSKKGTGPFRDLLAKLKVHVPGGHPHKSPVKAVQEAGALTDATLIHVNNPERGDLTRIKKADSCVVVCPNSNRWFGRNMKDHPMRELMEKSIPVALGTDSLASNLDVDMAAEMRTALEEFSFLAPGDVFQMATIGGAKALKLPKGCGTLHAGAPLDAVAVHLTGAEGRRGFLWDIIKPGRHVSMVFVSGRKLYAKKGGR
ncbi:MAG: amidohydrolase family protein [Nitrospinae bacterium]|nr:amidohydrolase family protein [Nitrospinota bacterium]